MNKDSQIASMVSQLTDAQKKQFIRFLIKILTKTIKEEVEQ